MSKEKELIECVKSLLWELENGYPKESKEEINQRIERIKELNQNKGKSFSPFSKRVWE
jgi:hypothetical protein